MVLVKLYENIANIIDDFLKNYEKELLFKILRDIFNLAIIYYCFDVMLTRPNEYNENIPLDCSNAMDRLSQLLKKTIELYGFKEREFKNYLVFLETIYKNCDKNVIEGLSDNVKIPRITDYLPDIPNHKEVFVAILKNKEKFEKLLSILNPRNHHNFNLYEKIFNIGIDLEEEVINDFKALIEYFIDLYTNNNY